LDNDRDLTLQLAIPPSTFVDVASKLKQHNYTGKSNRICIEKPFGKDTDSCKEMMSKIMKHWKDEEIYRIDHFLGEEMVSSNGIVFAVVTSSDKEFV
jgi:glucose-6-phosphate 1-dehydrogenase